jgi:hypothetical protein
MTSPDTSRDTPNTTATMPGNVVTQPTNARPVGTRDDAPPSETPNRGEVNVRADASSPSYGAQAPKAGGTPTKSTHVGGSGLRYAVQELAKSIDCLCGTTGSRDPVGARSHLDLANHFLGGLSQEGDAQGVPEASSSVPAVATVRAGGPEDARQDPKRATR